MSKSTFFSRRPRIAGAAPHKDGAGGERLPAKRWRPRSVLMALTKYVPWIGSGGALGGLLAVELGVVLGLLAFTLAIVWLVLMLGRSEARFERLLKVIRAATQPSAEAAEHQLADKPTH